MEKFGQNDVFFDPDA